MRDYIIHIMKLIVAVLVALEVSIPPNPYKIQLVVGLIVLICLQHRIPEKLTSLLDRFPK